jgi:hypothetical protein
MSAAPSREHCGNLSYRIHTNIDWCPICGALRVNEDRWIAPRGPAMQLIWYQRKDGLWNATCACNATIVGHPYERRADAEAAHFEIASTERALRADHPERFGGNQIHDCGPKLPEPNPNDPDPFVFA